MSRVRLKIKEIAEDKGYNMSSLSRATNISFNTIKRLFRHPEQGVNIITLNRIAEVLGVTVNDLVEVIPDSENHSG